MISIGMSNTSCEFSQFIELADAGARKNPNLAMVDGALEGASATKIAFPSGGYWTLPNAATTPMNKRPE